MSETKRQPAAPRYMALAESLRAQIARGEPEVGELLPTEHALCETYKVSRHTVREALRILAEAGLIARRRGAGTVVIAHESRAAFAQRLGNVDDLMQYARDARLQPDRSDTLTLDKALARTMGVTPGGRFRRVTGLRGEPGAPALAFTHIYIREDLAPPTELLVELGGLVTEWIAENKGVPTARIEQSISAGSLSAEEASALSAAPGGPALRTRRRYYDSSGRIIAMSDNVHPGERFTYEMVLKRESE
ncbi:MAG: GntR family transcriptional regulator [Pseudomonadota bacterium]